jgi:hypothetical protein
MAKTHVFALVGLLAFSAAALAQNVPAASAVMSEAQAKAAKEKKAVWVVFDASW